MHLTCLFNNFVNSLFFWLNQPLTCLRNSHHATTRSLCPFNLRYHMVFSKNNAREAFLYIRIALGEKRPLLWDDFGIRNVMKINHGKVKFPLQFSGPKSRAVTKSHDLSRADARFFSCLFKFMCLFSEFIQHFAEVTMILVNDVDEGTTYDNSIGSVFNYAFSMLRLWNSKVSLG